MKKHILLILFFEFLTILVGKAQQPGDLDVSFGNSGMTTIGEASTRSDQGRSVALTEEGYITVTGRVQGVSGQDTDVIIVQLSAEGQPYIPFGLNGVSVIDLGGTSDIGQDILQSESGKTLIAAGNNSSGVFESTILGLSSAGNLDPDFGTGGRIDLSVGGSSSGLFRIITDGEGNVVGGGSIYSPNSLLYVTKFDSNGALNEQFGNLGIQTVSVAPFHNVISGIVGHESGKITATSSGYDFLSPTETYTYGQVWQLNEDGTFDTDFNGTGILDIELSSTSTGISGLVRYGDGRLLIVGNAEDADGFKMFAMRLHANGTYDISFGSGGVVWFDNPVDISYGANSFVIQPDGKVIIGGSVYDGVNRDFFLQRVNEDGSLDPTFGNNGVVITEISEGYDAIADMALQADGKLVVAGTANINGNDDIAIARYHTGLNISVNEIGEEPLFSVYPNPATETLTVKTDRKLKNVELVDALGRSLPLLPFWQGGAGGVRQASIGIGHLPTGIYLLRATGGKNFYTQIVVKP